MFSIWCRHVQPGAAVPVPVDQPGGGAGGRLALPPPLPRQAAQAQHPPRAPQDSLCSALRSHHGGKAKGEEIKTNLSQTKIKQKTSWKREGGGGSNHLDVTYNHLCFVLF